MPSVTFSLIDFLGPLGLTVFLLFVNWKLIAGYRKQAELLKDQTDERIEKIENSLNSCKKSHDDLTEKYTELKQSYGYLKGRLEVLEHINPTQIVSEITDVIKIHLKAV